MKILIADDSIVSRHLLEATLRKWGYEVVVACDGGEALEVLAARRHTAVRHPGLDDACSYRTGSVRKIRQRAHEPYTYILLLTSKSQKEDLIEGMEAGADDYITKPFDQHELKVRLRAGTRLVDMQAELMATREALREQATHDSLTQLWNRSSILEILDAGTGALAAEGAEPLGMVIVDLDHFKNVNDTHGHLAGDAVLCESARRMHSAIRQYDSIGRYGGEEFLILLPGCDEHGSFNQAERLRRQRRRRSTCH